MTSSDAPYGERQAAPGAVLAHGLHGIVGTGRLEPARATGKGGQDELVSTNQNQRDAHAQGHLRPRAAKLPQGGKKISLDEAERRVRDAALGDGHHIEAAIARAIQTAPEHVAHPALGAVAIDGATDAARRHNPESIHRAAIRFADECDESARHAPAAVIHRQELATGMEPDVGTECVSHARRTIAPG
jgi:hypothetical protein